MRRPAACSGGGAAVNGTATAMVTFANECRGAGVPGRPGRIGGSATSLSGRTTGRMLMIVSARGTVVTAAVAAVVGLGALLAPAALAAPHAAAPGSPVVTGWAPAGRAGVHPGVLTETDGGGSCTADFVFTDGPRVLLGQAAHCAGTGGSAETDGCGAATAPLGTAVTVHGSDGRDHLGTMVYNSWVEMRADGEDDPAVCSYNDFALVELSGADAADVNPSMPFFGGPTGIGDGDLPTGSGG